MLEIRGQQINSVFGEGVYPHFGANEANLACCPALNGLGTFNISGRIARIESVGGLTTMEGNPSRKKGADHE